MEHHLHRTTGVFLRGPIKERAKNNLFRGLNVQMQPRRLIQHLITLTCRETFCKGVFFLGAAYTTNPQGMTIKNFFLKKHE